MVAGLPEQDIRIISPDLGGADLAASDPARARHRQHQGIRRGHHGVVAARLGIPDALRPDLHHADEMTAASTRR